jgi:flavorubredoxin
MAEIHEIADRIYRICHFDANYAPLEFTQFLLVDETPLLFHTGQKALFPETLDAVKRVLGDAGTLRYISYSHVEADECGAMNDFLDAAPAAEVVHGEIAAMIGQGDFFSRPLRALTDGEVLDLGQKKLRFLITPHVPHAWDAILVFEETTGTLFCSDLFTVFGRSEPVTEGDLIQRSMETLAQLPGYLPVGPHTAAVFDRLESLQPKVLAGHHSSAYAGDAVRALRDLRAELFATSRGSPA